MHSVLQGVSQSGPESILDYGVNFCNMYNLFDGSGLVGSEGFEYETSDYVCTQYSQRDCDKY